MRVLGLNFTKISAARLSNKVEKLKINTKIDIPEIKEAKSEMFNSKEGFLNVSFSFIVDYQPDFANVEILGNVLLAMEKSKAEEIVKNWKSKEMDESFRMALFNIIMKKSSLKALQLEEEINLPHHIQLPVLKNPQKKEEKE